MNEHLLRMEGVNLSAVLDDTSEISIRRGAGLMLRQAVRDVALDFPGILEPISLGASVGLFSFTNEDPASAVEQVAAYLNRHYSRLTFVVDSAPLAAGFRKAHEQVIARNRMRQFQQLTLPVPAVSSGLECCEMTRLHPAMTTLRKGDEEIRVSDSARERYLYGRENRQRFYSKECDETVDYRFTTDLQELADPSAGQDFGNLNGKMAAIYLDGNKFGRIQQRCKTAEELKAFDREVQTHRREFLHTLLQEAALEKQFMNHDAIRLETLLWGGDEILLVVPAWKGMEVLQRFFECSAQWTFQRRRLTHAAGVVFCHCKTPVVQFVKTAQALANRVKEQLAENNTPEENAFDYLVLESIDYPTQELGVFWELRYGKGVKGHCPPLRAFSEKSDVLWAHLLPVVSKTLDDLPAGAVREIGQLWAAYWKSGGQDMRLEARVERMREVSKAPYSRLFDRLFGYFNETPPSQEAEEQHHNPGWLHLTELWDYLAPVFKEEAG